VYEKILEDFGYDRAADEAARDELDDLLAPKLRVDMAALRGRFEDREAAIVGPLPAPLPDAPTLFTDAAASWALPLMRPDAIVTDLDGDVAAQLAANALGVPLFVHAHGDNQQALRAHVPHMLGPVHGTTQAEARGRVADYGGFTDGDRACCIAVELGAMSLALVGFDWEMPAGKPGRDPALKRRKLAWAHRIVQGLGVPARLA
jgi:uncharacterized Rossmann fold enzyme